MGEALSSAALIRVSAELVADVERELAEYQRDGDVRHVLRAWTRIRDAGLEPGPGLLPYLSAALERDPAPAKADSRRSAIAGMLLDNWRLTLVRLLTAWSEALGAGSFTAAEIIAAAGRKPKSALGLALREACNRSTPAARPLAGFLRRHAGRHVQQLRVVPAGQRDHTILWRVEKLNGGANPVKP